MHEIDVLTPKSVQEAVDLLTEENRLPIAGGTDLVLLLRNQVILPNSLVDLGHLNLDYIVEDNEKIRIGSTTNFTMISESELIQEKIPVLAQAAALIGSVQCRNMATIGGNICSAIPSADSAPPLMALNATLKLSGKNNERVVKICDFFVGPRKSILKDSELLVEIQIPIPDPNTGLSFYKFGRRKALTLSIVNVAAYLQKADNYKEIIQDARIVIGAAAPTPIRAIRAETFLIGSEFSELLIKEAAEIASQEIKPISDIRSSRSYRIDLTKVLVRRALMQSWKNASSNDGDRYR